MSDVLEELADQIRRDLFNKGSYYVPKSLRDKVEFYINKRGKVALRNKKRK